ncbi:DEAD/DEAH box helicase, partial [Acetobacter tropicalis]
MTEIADTLSLSSDDVRASRSFLDCLIQRRRAETCSAWRITSHKTMKRDNLPEYDPDWQNGITFIRAPMGSGKSARIGRPFISASMNRRYTVASTPSRALCHEQASKFGIDLYSDVGGQGYASPAMSVCIPSLDKHGLQEQIGGASAFLFDEWSQSLALLAARGVCNKADFEKLTRICSTMDAGIFADAFLSDFDIQFVTSIMKPGLPIRIYDVDDQGQEFRARHTYGSKAREWIVHEILKELHNGGKCWVSCEGRRSSQTIGEILQQDGHRVLIVNKTTRDTPDVRAFLANAEEQCLQYDVIVHSPTITSGMSITGEKHGNHFTRGFFLGAGWKLQPKICAQMLRRVRYIREWSIGIAPNNSAQTVTEATEGAARAEIAALALQLHFVLSSESMGNHDSG